MREVSSVLAVAAWLLAVPAGAFAQAIPVSEQNVLVQRHCAVCHTDKARNGGLSLQHFDAADAPPSLVAMMVSKLTQGLLLATVQAAPADSRAADLVTRGVDGGAMFAAGIKIPIPAIAAFTTSLAARAIEPTMWHSSRTPDPVTGKELTMVSRWRELPTEREGGVVPAYRLVLTCNQTTREGEMQLAWSPSSKRGTLLVAADGRTPSAYTVDGTEQRGDGGSGTTGPAAHTLMQTKPGSRATAAALPTRVLSASGLFPSETVEFSFDDMPAAMRQSLMPCFDGSPSGL
jgi:hypothetical protein